MENYIEKHKEKIQKTPGGTLCQVFGANEGASCSVALVKMDKNSEGIKHYHDNITEIYLFAKGKGKIVINGNTNIVNNGDCYIIPANNVHYISAESEMDFACICTPPWTEEHEFSVDEEVNGENISLYNGNGVLQVLGSEIEHSVKMYEVNNYFEPNENMKKYRRVYYFIAGKGLININNENYDIEPGECYEVFEQSTEYIKTNEMLKFVIVCDVIKN